MPRAQQLSKRNIKINLTLYKVRNIKYRKLSYIIFFFEDMILTQSKTYSQAYGYLNGYLSYN